MIEYDYSTEVRRRFQKEDDKASCPEITFQVTDDCCLKCSYCYQGNKSHNMMSKETAKNIIDLLFKMYDENNEESIINHHTKGLVLSFIGGEPFMNIDTINFAAEYFINECFSRNHIWLTNFRFSISTNGLLYFDSRVQAFLKKYDDFISMTITLDGPKEIHDICRVDYDNKGSFDRSYAAWEDWNNKREIIDTKVTISPENLSKINTIFDFFISRGCKTLFANPIFEHEWTIEESKQYYALLIELAVKLLDKPNVKCSIFSEYCGKPLLSTYTQNWCGGTGAMLAFDPMGNAYPCLRYMPSSLNGEQKPLVIGDANGVYIKAEHKKVIEDMRGVTLQSQSSEECINCPVAMGCAYCSAYNYQVTGSYNKRVTKICWMHRARALANVFYWNLYYIKNNMSRRLPLYLPRSVAKQIISDTEYDMLYKLSTL